jgi:uncharacterized protein
MLFSWDPGKDERNRRERGFGFHIAALIFEGITLEWPDDRTAYGETRVRAIGMAQGLILHVVDTDRDETRRIISARPANRKERDRWLSRQ